MTYNGIVRYENSIKDCGDHWVVGGTWTGYPNNVVWSSVPVDMNPSLGNFNYPLSGAPQNFSASFYISYDSPQTIGSVLYETGTPRYDCSMTLDVFYNDTSSLTGWHHLGYYTGEGVWTNLAYWGAHQYWAFSVNERLNTDLTSYPVYPPDRTYLTNFDIRSGSGGSGNRMWPTPIAHLTDHIYVSDYPSITAHISRTDAIHIADLWRKIVPSTDHISINSALNLFGHISKYDTIHLTDSKTIHSNVSLLDVLRASDHASAGSVVRLADSLHLGDTLSHRARLTLTDSLHVGDTSSLTATIAGYDLLRLAEYVDFLTSPTIEYFSASVGGSVFPSSAPTRLSTSWLAAPRLIDGSNHDMSTGYSITGNAPILWALATMPSKKQLTSVGITAQCGSEPVIASMWGSDDGATWTSVGWIQSGVPYRDLNVVNGSETLTTNATYHYYLFAFRAAHNTTFTISDLRLFDGTEITPGLIKVSDSLSLSDAIARAVLIMITDGISFSEAVNVRNIMQSGYKLDHPDQPIGNDEGYAVESSRIVKQFVDYILMSDMWGINKTISLTDTITFIDVAKLKGTLRQFYDTWRITDSAKAITGTVDYSSLSDSVVIQALIQVTDSIRLNDLAKAGIQRSATDSFTITDAAAVVLAAVNAIDGFELADVAAVAVAPTNGEHVGFGDSVGITVYISLTDTLHMTDHGFAVQAKVALDTLTFSDGVTVSGLTSGAIDNFRLSELINVSVDGEELPPVALPGDSAGFSDTVGIVAQLTLPDYVSIVDSVKLAAHGNKTDNVALSDSVVIRVIQKQDLSTWS